MQIPIKGFCRINIALLTVKINIKMSEKRISKDFLAQNDITVKNSISITAIAMLICGLASCIYAITAATGSEYEMPILFVSFTLTVAGIAIFFIRKQVYINNGTGETFNEETIYFHESDKEMVMENLKNGNFAELVKLARNNSTLALRVELFYTKNEEVGMYRISNYIPHTYQPITEFVLYRK